MLIETKITPGLFELPTDPLGEMILIPAFEQARTVKGAFGWFSSGWISRLAPGLASYIARSDTNPITFTISPRLYDAEYEALKLGGLEKRVLFERVGEVFTSAKTGPEAMAKHAVDCLSWLVATNRLELRIAKPVPGGNYHPKIWLFDDDEDQVAVRGSANATGRALGGGVEHMDVDCTWVDRRRVDKTVCMLDAWSRGDSPVIERVYDLEDALREQIIELAPTTAPTVNDYVAAAARDQGRGVACPPASFCIPRDLIWQEGRFVHQARAVEAWEESGRTGMLEMATGAGKTIAALVCAQRTYESERKGFLIVISVPSTPLIGQWREVVKEFGINAITPTMEGSVSGKQSAIANALLRLRTGAPHRVETLIVTNHLMGSSSFQRTLRDAQARTPGMRILHIGDEAHSLGVPRFLRNLPKFIDYRLGLSATPERQYDDEGTKQLQSYFGPTVFEFGLKEAVGFCLVPYDYKVHVAHLNDEELEEFNALSVEIGRKVASQHGELDLSNESLTTLLVKRRAIIESAEDKVRVLREILSTRSRRYGQLLIYSTSKNSEQHEAAKGVVADLGYVFRQVTQVETAQPGLVPRILASFAEGDFEVLLAKKVLDEGVDVPSTREAILLSSSTVRREWIQRRGRVLRKAPGKNSALVHDVLALPPPKDFGSYPDNVVGLINRELDRVRAFGEHARNWKEVSRTLDNLQKTYILDR